MKTRVRERVRTDIGGGVRWRPFLRGIACCEGQVFSFEEVNLCFYLALLTW